MELKACSYFRGSPQNLCTGCGQAWSPHYGERRAPKPAVKPVPEAQQQQESVSVQSTIKPATVAPIQAGLFASIRTPIDPAIKYAGGKGWLLPRLGRLWHRHRERRLVEPFAGSGAVALGFAPKRVLLNDINPVLINLHRNLQRGLVVPDEIEFRYERDLYDAHRERLNLLISRDDIESAEAAALFYYLNRTTFNGLMRFNLAAGFNSPFGKHGTVNYNRDFSVYREAMWGWEISCGDFERMNPRPGDFLYADPPYDSDDDSDTDTAFTAYSKERFDWAEQIRLANWLVKFDGPIVASNLAIDRMIALYEARGFSVETLMAPRNINSRGDRRKPVEEMLATRGLKN